MEGAAASGLEIDEHRARLDPLVIETWVRGWTVSRGAKPPVRTPMGFHVDVGLPTQKARHVLTAFEPDRIRALAASIDEPWVFIKVPAAPDRVAAILPARWAIQSPIYLMTTRWAEDIGAPSPAAGYRAEVFDEGALLRAEVRDANGELAANGRGALADETCVFDQIVTDGDHRRRGLGRLVMALLSQRAASRGYRRGALVASEDGLALYRTIGWTLHSPMTSAVILPVEG